MPPKKSKKSHDYHKQPMVLLAVIIGISLIGMIVNFVILGAVTRDIALMKIRVQALERVNTGQ